MFVFLQYRRKRVFCSTEGNVQFAVQNEMGSLQYRRKRVGTDQSVSCLYFCSTEGNVQFAVQKETCRSRSISFFSSKEFRLLFNYVYIFAVRSEYKACLPELFNRSRTKQIQIFFDSNIIFCLHFYLYFSIYSLIQRHGIVIIETCHI